MAKTEKKWYVLRAASGKEFKVKEYIDAEIKLPEGVEMVMPGDNVEIEVELIYAVALNEGLRFAIREGGRTVGSGQITKILED